MAIVRTTTKDPKSGGTAPPADASGNGAPKVDRTKSVVSQAKPARPPVARQMPGRTGLTTSQTKASPRTFLEDTLAELRRVVWPSNETVRSGTLVTIGLLICFGLYIAGLDYVAVAIFQALGIYPPATPS